MPSNKYSRHNSVVSRQSDDNIDGDHWFKQFQKSLLKDAVQPKTPTSLFDQINSIMNGSGSKYTSVDAAVKDMQERSGLTAYLGKVSKDKVINTKIAADENQATAIEKNNTYPGIIQKCPAILKTLENYIKSTKGNLPVPAIIDKIRSIHQSDISNASDWEDDNLIRLVSKMNLMAKRDNPASYQNYNNLGNSDSDANSEIDPSNTDAFHALTPAKI